MYDALRPLTYHFVETGQMGLKELNMAAKSVFGAECDLEELAGTIGGQQFLLKGPTGAVPLVYIGSTRIVGHFIIAEGAHQQAIFMNGVGQAEAVGLAVG